MDITLNVANVTVSHSYSGRTVEVSLSDVDIVELVKQAAENDIASLIGELDPSDVAEHMDNVKLLNQIGEDACIKQFGLTKAE